MGKLTEAYVDVVVRQDGLDKGLAQSHAKINRFATGANQALGRVGFAGLALGGAAFSGAIGGLVAAAKKASDLGESVSKVDVTFGKAAKHIHATADDLAKRFGVVKRESLDAAASFGLMGLAAGQSQDQAAKLGSELTKLGVDLASYHNLTNEEAFLRLRSGLAGEAEPLRRLGILLSEDAVKSEALKLGLRGVKGELTEAQKVVDRVSLIQRQAGPAIGDRARTESSTANQLKKLQGDFENAATEFGKDLQEGLIAAIRLAEKLATIIKEATGERPGQAVGGAIKTAANTATVVAEDFRKGGALSTVARFVFGGVPGLAGTPGLGGKINEIGQSFGTGRAPRLFPSVQDTANEALGATRANETKANRSATAVAREKYLREWNASAAKIVAGMDADKNRRARNLIDDAKRFAPGAIRELLGMNGPALGLQGARGGLLREGIGLAAGMAQVVAPKIFDQVERKESSKVSGAFSGEDYARQLIVGALNTDETPQQQLATLRDIKTGINQLVENAKDSIRGAASGFGAMGAWVPPSDGS